MIRTALLFPETGEIRLGGEEALEVWRADASTCVWVDLNDEPREAEREFLQKHFPVTSLALDDAQRPRHPPKLEWFDDHFFLLLKAFSARTETIDFEILHISFFVGERFLVTRHPEASPSIDGAWDEMMAHPRAAELGPHRLCYRIVRRIIDRYTPIVLGMEGRLDELEEIMLEQPSDAVLAELTGYNSRLKKLRRIFGYQRAVLAELAERSASFPAEVAHEFQDAREHMDRLTSLTELLQGLARDLMDSYISVSAHRLNQIMKLLTIVAAIFLPLTFLAGVYGMNFENMPELQTRSGYFILLGIMALLASGMILLFRKLRWL